jgi:hypothetical protein
MKELIERFDCKNEKGKILFYVELKWKYGAMVLCSIPSTITHTDAVAMVIRCIEEPLVPQTGKLMFIQELIKLIQNIPGIEKYYMK